MISDRIIFANCEEDENESILLRNADATGTFIMNHFRQSEISIRYKDEESLSNSLNDKNDFALKTEFGET